MPNQQEQVDKRKRKIKGKGACTRVARDFFVDPCFGDTTFTYNTHPTQPPSSIMYVALAFSLLGSTYIACLFIPNVIDVHLYTDLRNKLDHHEDRLLFVSLYENPISSPVPGNPPGWKRVL